MKVSELKPQELVTKWIAALRSGQYKQARGSLRRTVGDFGEDTGYCCLGVLCDLSGIGEWDKGNRYTGPWDDSDDSATTMLPVILREALGIMSTQESHLIHLNDGAPGMPSNIEPQGFPVIADYIEQQILPHVPEMVRPDLVPQFDLP